MIERIADFVESRKEDCARLNKAFYDFQINKWNKQTYCLELCIQLSHYVYVSMNNEGLKKEIKEEFRDLNDIADEICDVMYQVINIMLEFDLSIEKKDNYDGFKLPQEIKKETCIVLAGQIADAVLRREACKHDNLRTIKQEDELILKNCTYILLCMFDDMDRMGMDPEKEFTKMLQDAWQYLEKYKIKF